MKATIKKIDKELRELCNAHLQINSYFYGEFLDTYESNKVAHTSLLANITDASQDSHYITLVLSLAVCDKIDDAKTVSKDVDSETLQVLNDVLKVIKYTNRWKEFGVVTDTTSLLNFSERGGSVVNGWACKLNLKIKNEVGFCDLPIENYNYD